MHSIHCTAFCVLDCIYTFSGHKLRSGTILNIASRVTDMDISADLLDMAVCRSGYDISDKALLFKKSTNLAVLAQNRRGKEVPSSLEEDTPGQTFIQLQTARTWSLLAVVTQ